MEIRQIGTEGMVGEAYAKTKPEILRACIMCENPGGLACAICGTKYCSQACQKQDWKYHKMLCKSSVGPEFHLDKRPGPNHRRIIVFPVDQTQPVWDWARFQNDNDGPSGFAPAEYRRLVKCPSDTFVNTHIPLNTGPPNPYMRFGRGLQAFSVGKKPHGLPELSAQTPINQSLLRLTKPGHVRPGFGPWVLAAFSSDEVGDPMVARGFVWEDATLKDLRLAVDNYTTGEHSFCVVDPDRYALQLRNPEAEVWPAFKLNCKDIQQLGLKPEDDIEPVLVASIACREERHNSALANRLGLSWVWEKTDKKPPFQHPFDLFRADQDFQFQFEAGHYPRGVTSSDISCLVDNALRHLHLGGYEYGGTILLMHKQGRPLHRAHVQAVIEFKDMVYTTGLSDFIKSRVQGSPISETFDRSRLTRENFEAYWDVQWGESGVPSPYTLED